MTTPALTRSAAVMLTAASAAGLPDPRMVEIGSAINLQLASPADVAAWGVFLGAVVSAPRVHDETDARFHQAIGFHGGHPVHAYHVAYGEVSAA